MKNREKKKIMGYVWFVTDIIILICAVLLLMEGGTFNVVVAIIGILLVIVELYLYKTGKLSKMIK
ncbi:MAG TPA: hypothetical protein HA277_05215 [Methanosphaera sp.]|nr:hypothetical protein [Methanosphaera sp.]HII07990.1 hypothetical protein [Methanosphaera sp.]HIJ15786.1 hypothetical protein [Methanosphaera sp.]